MSRIVQLADSAWPRFRGNSGASGKSKYSGPKEKEITWRINTGEVTGEPTIAPDGIIYLPREEELISVSMDGEILWRKQIFAHRETPLWGITTPAVREDGSIIVAALRNVVCLEPDGNERWHHLIDGLPSAPNIGMDGTIYVSAWSIDWAGMYVISPDGNPTGEDDPKVFEKWSAHRSVEVVPAALDGRGNVYIAFHANFTHPEAYTWDPPDEVSEDLFYACSIFDADGKRTGLFLPWQFRSGTHFKNAVCIGLDDLVHYQSGGNGEIYVFENNAVSEVHVPDDNDFLTYYYLQEFSKPAYDRVQTFQERLVECCKWTWDRFRDKNEEDQKGEAFGRKVIGWPAIGENSVSWMRLSKKQSPFETKKLDTPSDTLLRIDSSMIEQDNTFDYSTFNFSADISSDPTIDQDGFIYIGTSDGKVTVTDSLGIKVDVISLGHSISSMVIGPENSLIVVGNRGELSLVR